MHHVECGNLLALCPARLVSLKELSLPKHFEWMKEVSKETLNAEAYVECGNLLAL
jgi:hypothetical protein